MIFQCIILNDIKRSLFSKNFVAEDFYSEFQLKTIQDAFPRLINIVELLSNTLTGKAISYKRFTITNLWVSILKTTKYFFIFISPSLFTSNNKPLDLETELSILVKKIGSLIEDCTKNKPHFDLSINKYFENTVLLYIRQYNMSEITKYEAVQLEVSKTIEKNIENRFINTLNKKYMMLGVGAVGKSSILAQFFDNWTTEELEQIKPTIFKTINNYNDSFIDRNFTLIDLGGQEVYLQQHLTDENLFKNLRSIIFVIDIQNEKKSVPTQRYLKEILEILKINNEHPFVSIFLHKYDPDKKEEMESNIQFWFSWLDANLTKYSLPFSYYLTSIYDNSARESLARTLLLTIPNWYLALIIKKDLIFRSFNSLLPILSEVERTSINFDSSSLRDDLFNNSVIFGHSITKIILQNWVGYLMKDESYSITYDDIKSVANEIFIEFHEETGLTELKFKCPLLERNVDKKFTSDKNICSLTHGLLTGLCQFTGLGKVTMVETQIRNNSDHCSFTILH